jgi:hypothetical protein
MHFDYFEEHNAVFINLQQNVVPGTQLVRHMKPLDTEEEIELGLLFLWVFGSLSLMLGIWCFTKVRAKREIRAKAKKAFEGTYEEVTALDASFTSNDHENKGSMAQYE